FQIGSEQSVVTTRALRVTVKHAPFRLALAPGFRGGAGAGAGGARPRGAGATASGESPDEDDADLGTAFAGERVKVWKRLRDDEHVYGFGEKVGKLDKRGWQLGGYSFTMWNTHTYGSDSSTPPISPPVPSF